MSDEQQGIAGRPLCIERREILGREVEVEVWPPGAVWSNDEGCQGETAWILVNSEGSVDSGATVYAETDEQGTAYLRIYWAGGEISSLRYTDGCYESALECLIGYVYLGPIGTKRYTALLCLGNDGRLRINLPTLEGAAPYIRWWRCEHCGSKRRCIGAGDDIASS